MKFSFFGLVVIIMVAGISACVHKPFPPTSTGPTGTTGTTGTTGNTDGCPPDTVYFTNTILPILQTYCATSGCHDSISHIEGFNLSSYNNVIKSRVVVPGDTSNSYLYYSLITSGQEGAVMPPTSYPPLAASQIQLIVTWILQGAKNNTCSSFCDTTNISYSASIKPILQAHCYGCHNAANNSLNGGGNNFENFSVLAGFANNGKLVGDINFTAGYNAMPLDSPQLNSCNIAKITQWAKIGAPNN